MGPEKEYKKIAQDVIKGLGGKENIISMAHCATRLRLIVKDRDIIDDEFIENVDKAKGVFLLLGNIKSFLEPVPSIEYMRP